MLLRPFASLYSFAVKLHQANKHTQKVDIPVLCIGNITAGGTGKTPTCLAIAKLLQSSGVSKNLHFLLRGYGGAEHGPILVNLDRHSSWDVGDESLILAKTAPTIVSSDRYKGAKHSIHNEADLIVMDDGLQNPSLYKDVKIVVINGEMGFGNEMVMPAGPLREPLEDGLKRADAFLIIGKDKTHIKDKLPSDKPVFHATLKANTATPLSKDLKYLAFAGLGYPEKFFNFMRDDLGYEVTKAIPFADHYPYQREDIQNLRKKAKDVGAQLMTTEKDYMRLPKGYKDDIMVLPVDMVFSDPDGISTFLRDRLFKTS